MAADPNRWGLQAPSKNESSTRVNHSMWKTIVAVLLSSVLTVFITLAANGVKAISREDVEAMIEKKEAVHEAKVDLMLDRLTKIEVAQGRMEEKVDLALGKR